MRLSATLVLTLAVAAAPLAQTVGSINMSASQSMDGLYVAPDGSLYATTGWLGSTINHIGMDGASTPFASGVNGPIHLVQAPDGRFFTTDFNSQTVSHILPNGSVSAFATTRDGPSDLAIGPDGALYVTHYGNPTGFGDGNSISRISASGEVTIFAEGGSLNGPVGLAFDDEGNLFVANIIDGRISKIAPDGTMSVFTSLPYVGTTGLTIGHLAWGNGELYATYLDGHEVWAFAPDGTGRVLAGTGVAGREDGPAATATFNRPNGIALSVTGDTLFVSEYIGPNQRIRTISPLAQPTTQEAPARDDIGLRAMPNPVRGTARLRYSLSKPAEVSIAVFDALGREVNRQDLGTKASGEHTASWAANDVPPGRYAVRLVAGEERATHLLTVQQ